MRIFFYFRYVKKIKSQIMKLLLLSNSTIPGLGYLEYAIPYIKDFLGPKPQNIAFVPYAAVTISNQDYVNKVNNVLNEYGYHFFSLHDENDFTEALSRADAIAVGGGNTFNLTYVLQATGLMKLIKEFVNNGLPFIGWSAGSNIACPSMRTTNDMPIIQPHSFDTLNFIPFQINPHYLDKNPEGHGGETREDRIKEFLELNRHIYVVGLREGTILHVENDNLRLLGNRPARIFRYGQEAYELTEKDDFNFLLKN